MLFHISFYMTMLEMENFPLSHVTLKDTNLSVCLSVVSLNISQMNNWCSSAPIPAQHWCISRFHSRLETVSFKKAGGLKANAEESFCWCVHVPEIGPGFFGGRKLFTWNRGLWDNSLWHAGSCGGLEGLCQKSVYGTVTPLKVLPLSAFFSPLCLSAST